jgi:hypothetical protein
MTFKLKGFPRFAKPHWWIPGAWARITYRDPQHTPDNKRQGEVASILTIEVDRNRNGVAVLRMEEITTSRSGKVAGRTISTQLDDEARQALAAYLMADDVAELVEGRTDGR